MKNFRQALKYGSGVGALGVSGSALAELPAGAATALTGLQTDGLALQALALAAMVALAVGSVIISMIVGWIRKGGKAAR